MLLYNLQDGTLPEDLFDYYSNGEEWICLCYNGTADDKVIGLFWFDNQFFVIESYPQYQMGYKSPFNPYSIGNNVFDIDMYIDFGYFDGLDKQQLKDITHSYL